MSSLKLETPLVCVTLAAPAADVAAAAIMSSLLQMVEGGVGTSEALSASFGDDDVDDDVDVIGGIIGDAIGGVADEWRLCDDDVCGVALLGGVMGVVEHASLQIKCKN